jgi:hypothetical protein
LEWAGTDLVTGSCHTNDAGSSPTFEKKARTVDILIGIEPSHERDERTSTHLYGHIQEQLASQKRYQYSQKYNPLDRDKVNGKSVKK